jgi:NAD(P)H dehydrogenase (quinone)
MPAILKCFIDMVFASGFAFRYKSGSSMPEKLLTGRTAHIITTMDTPFLFISICLVSQV